MKCILSWHTLLRAWLRWQGGVEEDEARRCNLDDFTAFTGKHRGAETLIVKMPSGGWAEGLSDLAYADHFSRKRAVVPSLHEVGASARLEGQQHNHERPVGLLLGHEIPANDVVHS